MGAIKDAFREMDKKTLLLMIGGIVLLIVIILVLSLLNKVSKIKYITYPETETKLVEAAKNYYRDNSSELPVNEKETTSVTLNTLVENRYIKPLSKYVKNGDKCDAQVVVTKLASDYDYMAYLNCGEDYASIELYKKIIEDNGITTSGIGLYEMDGEKVFRGEVKNNYVKLNDRLWKVLRIDENNNIVLMSYFKSDTFVWDDRYNIKVDLNVGINDYNISRIKDTIESKYYSGTLLTQVEKSKVVYSKICIGARKSDQEGSIKNIECSELSNEESPIRLLMVGEFIIPSLDPNCKTVVDKACTNYNFMTATSSSYWTTTKSVNTTSYAWTITSSGPVLERTNSLKQMRYVILLSTKTLYSSGSGVYSDPYIIR